MKQLTPNQTKWRYMIIKSYKKRLLTIKGIYLRQWLLTRIKRFEVDIILSQAALADTILKEVLAEEKKGQ